MLELKDNSFFHRPNDIKTFIIIIIILICGEGNIGQKMLYAPLSAIILC